MAFEKFLELLLKKMLLCKDSTEMASVCYSTYTDLNDKLKSISVNTSNTTLIINLSGGSRFALEAYSFISTKLRPEGMSDPDFNALKPVAIKLIVNGEWPKSILELFK